ncbi:tRNA lysidine(34) synthetase TilS [Candidatus Saganbacteria bacterium]|nr:tRNA lysidine(34) synthetase TilS [Candidatus Saganbacteria bacterium]
MIAKKALESIKEYKMIAPGDSILIAVSGGADSTALLNLLYSNKEELKISSLYVAHMNHLLRREEAEMDQRYVENLAKNLGLLCLSESADVEAYAAREKLSIEDAGRRLRYGFYDACAKKVGANKIALGHTADDMVETFLMRLLRGAGLKGLTGIPPVRGNIFRPLIKIWRKEIDNYIATLKLVPRIDHTNYESKYLRNRVRLKLIPQLKIYNLNIKEILLQTVLLLTEDYLYMESKTSDAIKEMISREKEGEIEIEADKLRKLPLPIAGHLIRTSIERVKGNLAELGFSHIQNIIKNLDSTEKWELHLPDSTFVFGAKNLLTITKSAPKAAEKISFHYNLKAPASIVIKETNIKISAEILESASGWSESQNTAVLDFDETGIDLIIRSRKDGDRFFPLGMRGAKKVQDFFVDLKIPQDMRDCVPIVEAAGRIVWVAPYRIDERNKVTKKTKKAVKLSFEKI